MEKYRNFAPTGFDPAGAFLPDRQDWLVAPVSRTRDTGDSITLSNWDAIVAILEEACNGAGEGEDTYEIHRFGHWGPGWYEIILINNENHHLVDAMEEAEAALEDYPALDEERMSVLETEAEQEAVEGWFGSDIEKELADYDAPPSWDDGPDRLDGPDMQDYFWTLDSDEQQELVWRAIRDLNGYFDHGGEGCVCSLCETEVAERLNELLLLREDEIQNGEFRRRQMSIDFDKVVDDDAEARNRVDLKSDFF